MEQNNINIAELLIDCEKGTELHSDIEGTVYFQRITKVTKDIYVCCTKENALKPNFYAFIDGAFYSNGHAIIGGKPTYAQMLFPSKKVRDWGCFNVKYVKGVNGKTKEIEELLVKEGGRMTGNYILCDGVNYIDKISGGIKNVSPDSLKGAYILSTGTELKLEKEEKPKFKVGDVVVDIKDNVDKYPLHVLCEYGQKLIEPYEWHYGSQTNVNCRLASPEEIARWNEEMLHPNHLHYDTKQRKLVYHFLPFDKVVVRLSKEQKWQANFFSHCIEHANGVDKTYVCIDDNYDFCLPYNEKTAKLIGTTDDYEEK